MKDKTRHSQIDNLKKFLAIPDKLEDDLATVAEARLSGTCQWFAARESFVEWSVLDSEAPKILWVTGRPAAGKSVLAGYIIDQLRSSRKNCSYYFFKYSDKARSRLSLCLRSIAFQMACTLPQTREKLFDMQKEGIKLDVDDARSLWRTLFLSNIFQTSWPRQYWIIDGLDESTNYAPFFEPMLGKLDGSMPLNILITSRESPELVREFSCLDSGRIWHERISIADSLPDIKLLAESKTRLVTIQDEAHRASLVEKILKKSEGSFLWTDLVLQKLTNSHTEGEMDQTLENMPREMEPLYCRILESMTSAISGRRLVKAILTWVTCALRPLTLAELESALNIDIKDKFAKLEQSLGALCGNLISVNRFGEVQLVHQTAREFLLSEELESEFAINKTKAHTQIAGSCLHYLTGEEMKPPRTNKPGSTSRRAAKRIDFSNYACASFSYHLARSDPVVNDLLTLTEKFLRSNVLSWIEVIAHSQNLYPLIRAAKNLKSYLNLCTTVRSPLGRSMHTIRGWTTDLIRIVAKFADALIMSPSAIYSLVMPFCPTESVIREASGSRRRLSVMGLSSAQWDDRLSCIDFHEIQTSTLCYGDEYFAVGLTTGTIKLYHAASCQEHKTLNHGESVKFLEFRCKTEMMASCGLKTINVWNISSTEVIHTFKTQLRIIALAFDKSTLIALSSKNFMALWDLDNDGARQPDRPWSDSQDHANSQIRLTPCAISISVGHQMLAIAYNGRPIVLWDLEEDAYYGGCGKKLPSGETSTHMVTALVFNPNQGISLLAVSYLDGELVLVDPFDDQEIEKFRASCHTLAASPDGRLLASGAGAGTIQSTSLKH